MSVKYLLTVINPWATVQHHTHTRCTLRSSAARSAMVRFLKCAVNTTCCGHTAHDRTQLYGTVRIPTNKPTQIAPRNEDTAKSTGSRMAFLSRDLSAKQAMAILSRGQHRAQSEETGHRSEGGRAHLSSRVAAAPPPRRLTTIDDRLAAAASP